jgi:choline-sulfatase
VKPPNLILLTTDQQRSPMHWPDEAGWLDELMPNDAELRRTGMSFTRAFIATSMCSPSRASIYTGLYPARHGVPLTMTHGDLFPDPGTLPDSLRTVARIAARGEVPRPRLARTFVRSALRLGPRAGNEPELSPSVRTLAHRLRDQGYHVALKGKWHLTKPLNGATWTVEDALRVERDHGFADWDATDAGGDAKAESFGGGRAGSTREGWDEDYTRQMERWLASEPPEPFCLVWNLINPHDVLGYPRSFERGGYSPDEFSDIHVPLPPTIDEDLRDKPTVQALNRLGVTSYLGELRTRPEQQRYVDFYAHLHRVVDRKLGRLLAKLGDPGDPASLRSRTVVVRTSDHGELGLSHGGLRQKMFNAYEEALHVPLVVSSPRLFDTPRSSDAMVSLVDLVPTMLGLAGAPVPSDVDGRDLGPVLRGETEAHRDAVLFTFDDHQAGTAFQDAPGQPNRIRAIRDERWKYALYFDPSERAASEHELYDLADDPAEARNLVDKRTGEGRTSAARSELPRMRALLARECDAVGATLP